MRKLAKRQAEREGNMFAFILSKRPPKRRKLSMRERAARGKIWPMYANGTANVFGKRKGLWRLSLTFRSWTSGLFVGCQTEQRATLWENGK